MKLYGKYIVSINSTKFDVLPNLSQSNYIALAFPEGFDMTLKLFDGSSATFFVGNDNQPVEIGQGEIHFHKIRGTSERRVLLPILLKSPEIDMMGNISFDDLYSRDPNHPNDWISEDVPLEANGTMIAKFGYVDKLPGEVPDFATYFDLIHSNVITNSQKIHFKIPGDVSNISKQSGVEIPIAAAMNSLPNFISLLVSSGLAVLTILLNYKLPREKNPKLAGKNTS